MAKVASAVDKVSYEDLYTRWEKGNWSAMEIDFSADRDEWHNQWSDLQRKAALWNYSLFFHGEDSVADNLSPFIDAAPREEQKYFLATQQVDEARHAVFFKRFMHEVVGAGDGTIASGLEATRGELTYGFVKTFEHLDRVTAELRRDRSRTKLAQAVAMYHVIVEATLAQPGQHFIEAYLDRKSTRLNSSHANISYAVFCLKKKIEVRVPASAATSASHHPLSSASTRHRRPSTVLDRYA